ncbi:unnamed protein product [Hydatigera taeniaeformis]|uniref:Fibronectin type-III domain-containing protein n=1 Tax=Hydatigena taeniaeformis TaxID=6205 RepID=A0A0R3WVU9_HYDTA|nr:unnamed protein product [Hydatigera taeniaeformis]
MGFVTGGEMSPHLCLIVVGTVIAHDDCASIVGSRFLQNVQFKGINSTLMKLTWSPLPTPPKEITDYTVSWSLGGAIQEDIDTTTDTSGHVCAVAATTKQADLDPMMNATVKSNSTTVSSSAQTTSTAPVQSSTSL